MSPGLGSRRGRLLGSTSRAGSSDIDDHGGHIRPAAPAATVAVMAAIGSASVSMNWIRASGSARVDRQVGGAGLE